MPLTPEQRSARSRKAARARWAKTTDRTAATAPARRALLNKIGTPEQRSAYFAEIGRRGGRVGGVRS